MVGKSGCLQCFTVTQNAIICNADYHVPIVFPRFWHISFGEISKVALLVFLMLKITAEPFDGIVFQSTICTRFTYPLPGQLMKK